MIFKRLIINQWKESIRSKTWNRQIGVNIFIGFLYSILALNILSAGFFLDIFFAETYPGSDPVVLFYRLLYYYFLADLFSRYFLQKIHGVSIKPFLHLPINKNKLKHFLLVKPSISLFNFTPFILIIPFTVKVLVNSYTGFDVAVMLVSVFIIFQFNNYLNLLINRLSFDRPALGIFYFMIIGASLFLSSAGVINFSWLTEKYFATVLNNYSAVLLPAALLALVYYFNFVILDDKLYLHQLEKKKNPLAEKLGNINLNSKYGAVGNFIELEIKMLLRNKRPVSVMSFAFIVLAMGFIVYTNEVYRANDFLFIYMSLFIISGFVMIYGQFIFAWESSYFDSILSLNISYREYISSKYIFILLLCLANFVLTIPYSYYGIEIIYKNIALLVYNLGINSFVLLLMGTYSKKRFDLSAGVMSQQGKGANQFLAVLPLLLLPLFLYLPFKMIGGEPFGYAGLAILGGTGLIFNNLILEFLTKQFVKRRYRMAEGFRDAE